MKKRIWALTALLAIGALPLLADALRSRGERCTLDGVEVRAAFRARIITRDGDGHSFCGVRCARAWLQRSGVEPQAVRVTDCATGRELDAQDAWFVLSLSVWGEGAPDFIRVFAAEDDAQRHAEAHGGEVLADGKRPFGATGREGHVFAGK